jgi:hypothetical protein
MEWVSIVIEPVNTPLSVIPAGIPVKVYLFKASLSAAGIGTVHGFLVFLSY